MHVDRDKFTFQIVGIIPNINLLLHYLLFFYPHIIEELHLLTCRNKLGMHSPLSQFYLYLPALSESNYTNEKIEIASAKNRILAGATIDTMSGK